MKLVVGLGNPGRRYQATRHNVGFLVIVELAKRYFASGLKTRFQGETAEADLEGKALLLTPNVHESQRGQRAGRANSIDSRTRPARRLRRPQSAAGKARVRAAGLPEDRRDWRHYSPLGYGGICPAANRHRGPAGGLELARFCLQQVYKRRNSRHGAGGRPGCGGDRGLGPRGCSGLHESIQWVTFGRRVGPRERGCRLWSHR